MILIAEKPPRFQPGQLVRHKRYGYRGVVVALDRHCKADERWYQSNRTQPDRNQPWYHVLVDGSGGATYAAQENLEEDSSAQPIEHPLLEHFFIELKDGLYVRNERLWPGW